MANGSNYSRTSNVSESIHSSLNKEFNSKINFETVIPKLATFKKKMIAKKASLVPINLLNQNPAPSNKKPIKITDRLRLATIHEKIRIFGLLDHDEQLVNLKKHLIDIGGKRRNIFLNNNIDFRTVSDSDE